MIWFKENDKIINAKIVSKNDEKLKEFINTNGSRSLKNYAFVEEIIGKNVVSGSGLQFRENDTVYYSSYYNDKNKIVSNKFAMTKLTTLMVVREALWYSENRDKVVGNCSSKIQLAGFFKDMEEDLKKIQSIVDTPYYFEFLQGLYPDYAAFLEIFPYIEIEQINCRDISVLRKITELEEEQDIYDDASFSATKKILSNEEDAKNNSKILCKTREFLVSCSTNGKADDVK